MSEAQLLYDDYQRKLAELRERCPHKSSHWAVEESVQGMRQVATGYKIKVCKNCGKHVERKLTEGNPYEDSDVVSGNGSVRIIKVAGSWGPLEFVFH